MSTILNAGKPDVPYSSLRALENALWDGNQISTYHSNNGAVVDHNATGNSGLEWPRFSGKTAVFASGIWLAGMVQGGLRTAAAEYTREFQPGAYGENPNDSNYRIYRIYKAEVDGMIAGNSTAEFDLNNDGVVETITIPTEDYREWPADDGAPFIDVDGNNLYNYTVDFPDILGDQFHWYIMNDNWSHANLWGTLPLHVEIQTSLFGFDRAPNDALGNTMFVRWVIINKGGDTIDSMYVSFWSDTDIGDANNDFVGCDPESNLGYSYNDFNGDVIYGSTPPAVGYIFLQTPIMPSPGDTAWVSGYPIPDFANIPMSAFSRYTEIHYNPVTAQMAYNFMNGLVGITGEPYIDPTTGQTSTFIFNGDPVTGDGWVDYNYYPSGDRRFLMTAGPFSMAPGDTQEVAASIVIAQGTDNISSITFLRQLAPWIQLAYDSDFNVIGPPLVFSNHIVPATTEDAIGPYHLEVDIHSNEGFVLEANSATVHYGVDGIDSVVPLVIGGTGNTFTADISGTGSTGMFQYYFYAEDSDGNGVYYPPGAPTGNLEFEAGPDQTPPVLENFTELTNTIHTFGSEAVKISANDRYPLEVALNYQVNNGSIQNQVMNRIQETERYETILTWSNLTLGDQIAYWVVAVDGSSAANTAVSDTHTFALTDSLAIGDWDTWRYQSVIPYNLDQNQWPDSAHWYSPRHGRWAGYNLDDLGVDAGWFIYAPTSGVQPDTVISGKAFDITPFQEASLAFRFACSVENITARVEVAPNYALGTYYDILDSSILHELNWTLVDSLVSVGGPGIIGDFVEQEISLSGFNTPLFVRITAQAPATSTPFIIDDIYLKVVHSLGTDTDDETIPGTFTLHQNYPNPFNPVTTIRYTLPIQTEVKLSIYNVLGQEVAVLLDQTQSAGSHKIKWNASNAASGIYFYRLETPRRQITKKLVVMK